MQPSSLRAGMTTESRVSGGAGREPALFMTHLQPVEIGFRVCRDLLENALARRGGRPAPLLARRLVVEHYPRNIEESLFRHRRHGMRGEPLRAPFAQLPERECRSDA